MPTELRDHLQSALGSAYELRRELGGGGMSRVFLAHEPALGRDVVVKVLHPELASGVSADRFKREIQLAAQLQHPHIVPILSAGETDGLPFLMMPYVAGRSLRERLSETGPLPIDEAVDILRDVARALAYAHGRGVIHRDIKPDNVLLAEGSATVTDFGVAKAVSASRTSDTSTLTSIGTSIGTPTYMAPEQAAGDPNTDHRADIYAWGVMAYELLAGRPPFIHATPHKLLAAHIAEAPVPVTDFRPDCPPALAALIAHCLAKDPDARPQSANDVLRGLADTRSLSGEEQSLPAIGLATRRTLVRALSLYAAAFVVVVALSETAVTMIGLPDWVLPSTLVIMTLGLPVVLFTAFVNYRSRVARIPTLTTGGSATSSTTMTRFAVKASPYMTWKRAALGGATAVGAFALLVVSFMVLRAFGIGPMGSLMAKGVIKQSDALVVTDFQSPANDSTLGAVMSEGMRTGLGESRAVRVVQPSAIAAALQRMEKPATTPLTLAVARDLAEREGIKAIVDGKVTPVGTSGSYILTARLLTAKGDELASAQETAKDATDLIPAIDRAARVLRGKLGESLKTVHGSMQLAQATTASLPALRKYTEGANANSVEQDYPKSIAALEEAIKLDSTFALAYRTASIVYNNARLNPGHSDFLRTRAFELRDRLPELERALVEANYYFRGGIHSDRAKALAASLRAEELDPASLPALSSLQLIYMNRRDFAKAESLSLRLADLGSAFGLTNAAQSEVSLGKGDAALRSIAEFERRFPKNPTVGFAAGAIWSALSNWDSVAVQAERARRSPLPQYRSQGAVNQYVLALVQGRTREATRFFDDWHHIDSLRGVPEDSVASRLLTVALDIAILDRPSLAVARLDSLVASPAFAGHASHRLEIANYYAAANVPDKARTMLAQYDAVVRDTAQQRIESNNHRFTEGRVALAEKKFDVAIAALWAADTLYDGGPAPCESCMLPELARAYDRAGKTDQAIAMFERYAHNTYVYRFTSTDPFYLGPSYERLAQLYEQKGDRAKAATYYGKFIDLWKRADPELQPRVVDARKRLALLTTTDKR